jgi:hypothetical protein
MTAPVLAHIGGIPLEEFLPALSGVSTGLLAFRGWNILRLRRHGSAK